MNGFTLYEKDIIGNPLIYPILEEETGLVEPGYSVSSGGLWSVSRGKGVINDNSLYLLSGERLRRIKNIFTGTKSYVGYFIPISIKEILEQEYAIPKDISTIGLSDEVLEEVLNSSFGAAQIYEMTPKNKEEQGIIAMKKTGGIKRHEDSQKEEIPEWGLPA